MAISLEQRIDVSRIGPNKWRVAGFVGRGIFFYAEAAGEEPNFSVNNQLTPGDVGSWRAIDTRRSLIIGQGGKATVAPKPDGQPGEVQVSFEGIGLAI